jgi:hypothetical protein
VKKDVNGHIPGPYSRNSIGSPLEFTTFSPEGVSITEYQLIRLRANVEKDYREFRTIGAGEYGFIYLSSRRRGRHGLDAMGKCIRSGCWTRAVED